MTATIVSSLLYSIVDLITSIILFYSNIITILEH